MPETLKKIEQNAPNWEIFRIGEFADIVLSILEMMKKTKNQNTGQEKLILKIYELVETNFGFQKINESLYSNSNIAKFLYENRQLAIFYSENYERKFKKLLRHKLSNQTQEISKTEISKISLFLTVFDFVEKGESLDLKFICFWDKTWNIIYLEINKDRIYLHRFLRDNETVLEYKGLGHYFMSFVKILAIKLNLPIVLQSTSQAIEFYKKENFVEIENGKMIWKNEPQITKENKK